MKSLARKAHHTQGRREWDRPRVGPPGHRSAVVHHRRRRAEAGDRGGRAGAGLPLLVLALLGVVQLALVVHAGQVVTAAAQEGARVAASEDRTAADGAAHATALLRAGLGRAAGGFSVGVAYEPPAGDVAVVAVAGVYPTLVPVPAGGLAAAGHGAGAGGAVPGRAVVGGAETVYGAVAARGRGREYALRGRSGSGGRPPRAAGPYRPGPDAQAGQSLVEAALVLPLVLLLAVGVVAAGRLTAAQGAVSAVAREAAQAAAAASGAEEARLRGADRALAVADGYGLRRDRLDVVVEAAPFVRGGVVRVRARLHRAPGRPPASRLGARSAREHRRGADRSLPVVLGGPVSALTGGPPAPAERGRRRERPNGSQAGRGCRRASGPAPSGARRSRWWPWCCRC